MQQKLLITKTAEMQRIEARTGRPIEELINELYHDQELTMADTAARIGVTTGALSNWMRRLGIAARSTSYRKVAV